MTNLQGVDDGARSKAQMTERGKIMTSVQVVDDWYKEQGARDGARENNDQCARGGEMVLGARSR